MELKRLAFIALLAALIPGGATATTPHFNPDPIFPIGPISERTSHQIAKLDKVASRLAGKTTVVNCWSDADWKRLQSWNSAHHHYDEVDDFGFTYDLWPRANRVQLSPFICGILRQTLTRPVDQPLMTAGAIALLAHEAAHSSGVARENRAECKAIQTIPRTATLLGLSQSLGVRLQHIYRGTIYPADDPRYNKPACPAGLPGVVAPSTWGPPAAVAPLRRIAAAINRVFPRWRNTGGWADFQPDSACPFEGGKSRVLARLEYSDQTADESVDVTLMTLATRAGIETALLRLTPVEHCVVAEWQRALILDHSGATVSHGRIPVAITHLSPRVRAYRVIWRYKRRVAYLDEVFVLNPATRRISFLYFAPAAGAFPLTTELRATKIALRY